MEGVVRFIARGSWAVFRASHDDIGDERIENRSRLEDMNIMSYRHLRRQNCGISAADIGNFLEYRQSHVRFFISFFNFHLSPAAHFHPTSSSYISEPATLFSHRQPLEIMRPWRTLSRVWRQREKECTKRESPSRLSYLCNIVADELEFVATLFEPISSANFSVQDHTFCLQSSEQISNDN